MVPYLEVRTGRRSAGAQLSSQTPARAVTIAATAPSPAQRAHPARRRSPRRCDSSRNTRGISGTSVPTGKPRGLRSHAIAKDPPALITATKISPEHAAALANPNETQEREQDERSQKRDDDLDEDRVARDRRRDAKISREESACDCADNPNHHVC